MKTEPEIRAYREAILKFKGCSTVEKTQQQYAMLELIAWILEEKGEET
jgi:hypothetical protein